MEMNVFSLIIAGLFGMLLMAFATLLTVAIVFNLAAGKRYRESLAKQLNSLRLGKMLTALGVDIDDYLHHERAVDIHDQMQRCSGCAQTERCDEQLADGKIDNDQLGFCNNEQTLVSLTTRNKPSPQ
jgi:hypothetical protein